MDSDFPLDRYLTKVHAESAVEAHKNELRMYTRDKTAIFQLLTDLNQDQIDQLISSIETLRTKLYQAREATNEHLKHANTALNHLTERLHIPEGSEGDRIRCEWNKKRVDRYLIDYLHRKGCIDTANTLAEDAGLSELIGSHVFVEAARISASLDEHQVHDALLWCFHNRSRLRRLGSTLEFQLRLQDFIEHIRAQRMRHAVAYSKKYLSQYGSTQLHEIQMAMSLLAFGPDTTCEKYASLLDPDRWKRLKSQFMLDTLLLHGMDPTPPLIHSLKAGLSVLKTRVCGLEQAHNPQCPVCDPEMSRLAAVLPYAQHSHSTLLCRVTGKLMNDDNPPMVLPNGNVYSLEAIEMLCRESGGWVTDPRSGEKFTRDEATKVFIS